MNIKSELDKLNEKDIYSLMLFALYKSADIPEYSSLSQLAYILDKDNLLRFCEYFGGLTLKVPTIEDIENLVYALLLYEEVDIQHRYFEEALGSLKRKGLDIKKIELNYGIIKELLNNYDFNSGRK